VPSVSEAEGQVSAALLVPREFPADGEAGAVLFLSLVHPDFLPSIYALAQVIRDSGYLPTIVSFSSLGPGNFDPGPKIEMVDCGSHVGTFFDRRDARARFRVVSEKASRRLNPVAIIASCPFSYLQALRIARGRPVIYFVEEIYETALRQFVRSPLSIFRNWRAQQRLDEAALVAAPSDERAQFIARKSRLRKQPVTILNSPYIGEDLVAKDDGSLDALLPDRIKTGVMVINTGRVSATQGILELVNSVELWPDDVRLVITGVNDSPYSNLVRMAVGRSPRNADICLLPLVSRATMISLQSRAHIGVCLLRRNDEPATIMPAPNKIGEYLKWGLIIVASRLPFLDQLAGRAVGELVDEMDPSLIARAVHAASAIASDPGSRTRVQRVSREWLNMNVQARPIIQLLEAKATFVSQ
jgi:glycosyltransferase involved in cell wall biosynthesis